jgi:hypothetical protein
MMNWIYNWYNPRKDVDVAGLSQNMTRLFVFGFLGSPVDQTLLETGKESHLDRTVSVWNH